MTCSDILKWMGERRDEIWAMMSWTLCDFRSSPMHLDRPDIILELKWKKKSGKIKQILCTSWGGHIYKSKWYSNTIIWQQFWDQNDHLLGLLCILFSCNHIQSFSNGLKATKTRFGTTFPRKCRSTRDWLLSLWHPVIRTAMPAFHLALPDRLKQVHIYVLRSNFKFYSSSE